MSTLCSANTIIPSSKLNGLDVEVTRYFCEERLGNDYATATDDGRAHVSLLFTHGVSFHKESWAPTIEHIFTIQSQGGHEKGFTIIEAWVIDLPNHGRSAVLNESKLLSRPEGISAYESAQAVRDFLAAKLTRGSDIIAIGHSAGACVLPLSTIGCPGSLLPFKAMILVEPPMMTQEVLNTIMKTGDAWNMLISMAKTRKDMWPSRQAAREWMSTRLPWKLWKTQSVDLFVQHGLRDLPTGTYPNSKHGVTLCCTRVQEVAGYAYVQDGVDSLNRLKYLCDVISVHCIFGERIDAVNQATQSAIAHPRSGRKFETITRVPNTGHLIVQENPQGLGQSIWNALHQTGTCAPVLGRL